MNLKRFLCRSLALLALASGMLASAVPTFNQPVSIVQPDGSKAELLGSGDEFGYRLYDRNNYTVVQAANKYVYYAKQGSDGFLTATTYRYGKVNPAAVGLKPGVCLAPEARKQVLDAWRKEHGPIPGDPDFKTFDFHHASDSVIIGTEVVSVKEVAKYAAATGQISFAGSGSSTIKQRAKPMVMLFIPIRFADTQFPTSGGDSLPGFDNMFNNRGNTSSPALNGDGSLRHFYNLMSYGNVDIFAFHCVKGNDVALDSSNMPYNTVLNKVNNVYVNDIDLNNIAFRDKNPLGTYCKYNATINPIGYKDGEDTGAYSMKGRAFQWIIDNKIIPLDLNIDSDNSGDVDSICFIYCESKMSLDKLINEVKTDGQGNLKTYWTGNSEGSGRSVSFSADYDMSQYKPSIGWAEALWPHSGGMGGYSFNGKRTSAYIQQLTGWGLYVFEHEMGHQQGAPDLYRYDTGGNPIGGWDLMCANSPSMCAWERYKNCHYGPDANGDGWWDSDDIPTIIKNSSNGGPTYKLYPTWCYPYPDPDAPLDATSAKSHNVMYKVPLKAGVSTGNVESLLLEYRHRGGGVTTSTSNKFQLYERSNPNEGLLVYRRNSTLNGNAGGPPDELYIYRPSENSYTDSPGGYLNSAPLGNATGRKTFDYTTNPRCFLGRKTNVKDTTVIDENKDAGIKIYDVVEGTEDIDWNLDGVIDANVPYVTFKIDGVPEPVPVLSVSRESVKGSGTFDVPVADGYIWDPLIDDGKSQNLLWNRNFKINYNSEIGWSIGASSGNVLQPPTGLAVSLPWVTTSADSDKATVKISDWNPTPLDRNAKMVVTSGSLKTSFSVRQPAMPTGVLKIEAGQANVSKADFDNSIAGYNITKTGWSTLGSITSAAFCTVVDGVPKWLDETTVQAQIPTIEVPPGGMSMVGVANPGSCYMFNVQSVVEDGKSFDPNYMYKSFTLKSTTDWLSVRPAYTNSDKINQSRWVVVERVDQNTTGRTRTAYLVFHIAPGYFGTWTAAQGMDFITKNNLLRVIVAVKQKPDGVMEVNRIDLPEPRPVNETETVGPGKDNLPMVFQIAKSPSKEGETPTVTLKNAGTWLSLTKNLRPVYDDVEGWGTFSLQTLEANPGDVERTALVTIAQKDQTSILVIKVTQPPPYLRTVQGPNSEISALPIEAVKGSTASFGVETNLAWEYSLASGADWATVSKSGTQLTVTAKTTNLTAAPRTATVTVKAAASTGSLLSKTVTITQPVAYLSLSTSSVTLYPGVVPSAQVTSPVIAVTANVPWTVENSTGAWSGLMAVKDGSNVVISSTANAAVGAIDRMGTCKIRCGDDIIQVLEVSQPAVSFEATVQKVTFVGEKDKVTAFAVRSNVHWSYSLVNPVPADQAAWLSVIKPSSDIGTATVLLRTLLDNDTKAARSQTLRLSGQGRIVNIAVEQADLVMISIANLWLDKFSGSSTVFSVNATSSMHWHMKAYLPSAADPTKPDETKDCSWLQFSPDDGIGSATVQAIAISDNVEKDENRRAILKVSLERLVNGVWTAKPLETCYIPVDQAPVLMKPTTTTMDLGAMATASARQTIAANIQWNVDSVSAPDWLDGVRQDTSLIITAKKTNTTGVARTATVVLKPAEPGRTINLQATITVTQPPAVLLSVSPTSLEFETSGGAKSLTVRFDKAWSVSSDQSWLTLSRLSGTGETTFQATAVANTNVAERAATITVKAEGVDGIAPIQIRVTQNGSGIYVNPSSLSLSREAGAVAPFLVSGNLAWTAVSSQPTWLAVTPASGPAGTTEVTAKALSANPDPYRARTAKITVTATIGATTLTKEVEVTQSPDDVKLAVSPSGTISAVSGGETKNFTVTSNAGWTVAAATSDTWLRPLTTTGSGNATVQVQVVANGKLARTGTVRFIPTGGGVPYEVKISQAAGTSAACVSTLQSVARSGPFTDGLYGFTARASASGIDVVERGVFWGTSAIPTLDDPTVSKQVCSGTTGAYAVLVKGLPRAQTIYVRAYLKDKNGTAYPSDSVVKIIIP